MQNKKERKVWIGIIIWLIVMMDVLLLLLALVFGLFHGILVFNQDLWHDLFYNDISIYTCIGCMFDI